MRLKTKKENNLKKILLSVAVATSVVIAAEPDLAKDDALVTHTELGYIETQGNTRTQTFNLDANLKKGWGRHIYQVSFDGQYASDKNVETKNKYSIELNYDYEFTDRFAFNYLVGFKKDRFSGYDYQAYTGPGAKYKAIKTENHNLSLDGNILFAQDDIEDTQYDASGAVIEYPNAAETPVATTVNGPVNNYSSYRAKAVYSWSILDNLKFNQDLSYRAEFNDSDNYFVTSKTALNSKISNIFSAGLSYKIDYINMQANGKEYTDRTFTANLIIDY